LSCQAGEENGKKSSEKKDSVVAKELLWRSLMLDHKN